jgi:hypothetical protein
MPMATPALNMERPWNGKDRAAAMRCLSNKVSLLQCAPCRLDVDYVGVSARLQEVSAWWYKAGSITQFEEASAFWAYQYPFMFYRIRHGKYFTFMRRGIGSPRTRREKLFIYLALAVFLYVRQAGQVHGIPALASCPLSPSCTRFVKEEKKARPHWSQTI